MAGYGPCVSGGVACVAEPALVYGALGREVFPFPYAAARAQRSSLSVFCRCAGECRPCFPDGVCLSRTGGRPFFKDAACVFRALGLPFCGASCRAVRPPCSGVSLRSGRGSLLARIVFPYRRGSSAVRSMCLSPPGHGLCSDHAECLSGMGRAGGSGISFAGLRGHVLSPVLDSLDLHPAGERKGEGPCREDARHFRLTGGIQEKARPIGRAGRIR